MKKWVVAGIASVVVVGTGVGVAAFAQGPMHKGFEHRFERMMDGEHKGWRGPRRPVSAEDRAAFLDARIAAVKAGLKLTPEQEKLWGPVETTARDLAMKWSERMAERREERKKRRAEWKENKERPAVDQIDRLRKRADALAERATDMKRFADAAQPLYATLDEGQKRRLQTLLNHRRHGWHQRWHHRDREDGPRKG